MKVTILIFIWLLIGYFVVRWAHKQERLPGIILGIVSMLFWPITLLVFMVSIIGSLQIPNERTLIDKIWGKRNG